MPNDSPDHVHIIVSGETLSKIADRYHLNLAELLAANPEIKDPNKIMVGQRVKIPDAAAPAPVMMPPVVPPAAHDTPAPAAAASAAAPAAPAGMPNTSGMDEASKYDLYAQYFSRFGVNLAALDAGVRALLGLRITSSTKVNHGLGAYDDRIVVVWRDSGGKHAKEFKGTTEPSGKYEGKEGLDANFDGRKDLGCLPDGTYQYQKSHSQNLGRILAPCSDIFVVRDVDHDGRFTAEDKAASVQEKLNSGRSVLFHAGGNSMTGSAACQTMPPEQFKGFWATLGDQPRYQYVLTTVA